jgi:hypothetical protein
LQQASEHGHAIVQAIVQDYDLPLGHDTKFRVEDMKSEITAIADVVIDHGLMKYHPWQSSSTLIHCETLEVVRYGSCFENIADILKLHFRIELPPRPASA